jgi:signal transduction histidine kinase
VDRDALIAYLRRLTLFEGLAVTDFDELLEGSSQRALRPGDALMRQGEPGESLFVIIRGAFEVVRTQDGFDNVVAMRGAGDVVGEMALLELNPADAIRSATVRSVEEAEVLEIGRAAFDDLLRCSPTAARAIVATFADRLRRGERLVMHQSKLAALGTMAAGLAHELNNPAAAISRTASHLREAVQGLGRATAELASVAGSHGCVDVMARLPGLPPGQAPAKSRLEREGALEEWLDAHGVDRGWEFAPPLAAVGWTPEALRDQVAPYGAGVRSAAVAYLAAVAAVEELLDDTHLSAEAISAIVGAVKRYAYLDQAPVQEIDVHEGLETTLTIMRHKLRGGVEVERRFGEGVPRIEAHGSELNQVWTNLIDNAVDAMGGSGKITLRTSKAPGGVAVEIHDTGPGIPEDVQARIFEPFFTTKGVGEGTGLGLHIAYTIVQRHHGQIVVRSQPGDTCFRVLLPVGR